MAFKYEPPLLFTSVVAETDGVGFVTSVVIEADVAVAGGPLKGEYDPFGGRGGTSFVTDALLSPRTSRYGFASIAMVADVAPS